jgi:quercetin dioxygenase-like cupin family protein
MKTLNRRKLLKSGAALAVSTMPAEKVFGAEVSAAGPFTVPSGEGRNGAVWLVHGEKAFSTKVSGADVGGRFAAIEVHTPPGYGPELHIHPGQNELFFMLKGSIGVQCGSDRTVLRTGDTLMAPANVPHAFVALGTEPAHMLFVFDPAGDIQGFFAEYAPLVSVNGEPDRKMLAEAYAKHGMKVVGPPLKASTFA